MSMPDAALLRGACSSPRSVTVVFAALIWRSRLGWAMRCIEQNEDASIVLGVNTLTAKVAGFVASAATAGLAGAIYATWIGYIDPTDAFDDLLSIKPIVMAFIGGVGTVAGPVVGAAIFVALEELVWRNVLNFHAGILGIIIVGLLVFMPGGLGQLRQAAARLRTLVGHQRRGAPAERTVMKGRGSSGRLWRSRESPNVSAALWRSTT